MKVLVVLAMVAALAAQAPAALAFECAPNFCDGVRCAPVDAASCDGVLRPHASFCGCCAQCIAVIQAGDSCFDGILGLPPTSECITGTACIDDVCTPLADTAQQ